MKTQVKVPEQFDSFRAKFTRILKSLNAFLRVRPVTIVFRISTRKLYVKFLCCETNYNKNLFSKFCCIIKTLIQNAIGYIAGVIFCSAFAIALVERKDDIWLAKVTIVDNIFIIVAERNIAKATVWISLLLMCCPSDVGKFSLLLIETLSVYSGLWLFSKKGASAFQRWISIRRKVQGKYS